MRVGFMIAGVQKGGTTSLAWYLSQHREIGFPTPINGHFRKELHFFHRRANFPGSVEDYTAYHAQFDAGSGRKIYGEATPLYICFPAAVARIHRYHPGMKIVVLFRNPAVRAWSHWKMQRDNGAEPLSFGEALRAEPQRYREAAPNFRRYGYVDRGRYAAQIRTLRSYFPPEQLCFVKSEAFFRDPMPVMKSLVDFLGVDSDFMFDRGRVLGRTRAHEAASVEDREFLREAFAPEIEPVEQLLGWDCSDWRN